MVDQRFGREQIRHRRGTAYRGNSHLLTSGEEIDFPSFTINKTGRIAIETNEEPTDLPLLSASKIIASFEETKLALVRAALKESQGNLSKAARKLGISRAKLAYQMQKNGISAD